MNYEKYLKITIMRDAAISTILVFLYIIIHTLSVRNSNHKKKKELEI